MDILKRLIVNEDGQGVIEYTLMVGLVVLALWAAVFYSTFLRQLGIYGRP